MVRSNILYDNTTTLLSKVRHPCHLQPYRQRVGQVQGGPHHHLIENLLFLAMI